MLKLNNIAKTFYLNENIKDPKHALKSINLHLKEGDFVTVIGANGSGKSTLLNIIAGSLSVDEGELFLNNIKLNKLKNFERSRFIGRVFQDPKSGSIAEMLVEENLFLASKRGKKTSLRWGIRKAQRLEFQALLASLNLDLENRLHDRMSHLSGGERQAITLLMALMNDPLLLLLDEHTAALDPKTAKVVMDLTNKLVKENKVTTLMVTHNMNDAIKYGNRLIMMAEGEIIFTSEGKEKENLTIEQLIKKFQEKTGNDLPDSLILNK
ncbi:MAG: ATP-binding cassette domain-containing protein [Bacilli bacterium]|jgi:putative ABC transport system ATP-binding protein|nr:ATP-binding cassette domain-containing protein [Erysipelotrichia bacterium]